MHLKVRNVNSAFTQMVNLFTGDIRWLRSGRYNKPNIVRRPSRNGEVLYIEEPVTLTYSHPRERVLFNEARDCNPFFHVFESLWMLAGREDVTPLAYYNSKIANYSDNGVTFNAAYGHRWRYAWDGVYDFPSENVNQLKIVANYLKADPNGRRGVVQMWNVEEDLLRIETSKDTACNLSVMFSMRDTDGYDRAKDARPPQYVLDMTVTNRSNDLIWGCLGANAVHFSFLQEYMAARIGCEVGVYNQFSNNLHVYTDKFEPDKWLDAEDRLGQLQGQYVGLDHLIPLVKDVEQFDKEVKLFIDEDWELPPTNEGATKWTEPFLKEVAEPMCRAFYMHKNKDSEAALEWCSLIAADDWRHACTAWIKRRMK